MYKKNKVTIWSSEFPSVDPYIEEALLENNSNDSSDCLNGNEFDKKSALYEDLVNRNSCETTIPVKLVLNSDENNSNESSDCLNGNEFNKKNALYEDLVDKNSCETTIPIKLVLNSDENNSNGSIFSVLPSSKTRGKHYYLQEDMQIINTEPMTWIPVELTGGKAGEKISITLKYADEGVEEESLHCAKHSIVLDVKAVKNVEIIPAPDYHSGPYERVLNIVSETDGIVKFSFIMHCLNSCTPKHPERIIMFQHLDDLENKTSCWKLRVSKNPKRDHFLMLDALDPKTGKKRHGYYSRMGVVKRTKSEVLLNPSEAPYYSLMGAVKRTKSEVLHNPSEAPNANFSNFQAAETVMQPSRNFEDAVINFNAANSIVHVVGNPETQPLFQEEDLVAEAVPEATQPPGFRVVMKTKEDDVLIKTLVIKIGGEIVD
ncbi:uncharacterized protein LOC108672414 isoform X2 [Hyalella azteca]|uniref:Uncharacterized protein LOC108672414 isoform X2 n=1 Tax=Hyalella azteca TaxID=294128 RepID=A0A979FPU1_HYAAZ|nr:uncharacterized protein LOC108672414 isoform X2 [Hyalella azteca]